MKLRRCSTILALGLALGLSACGGDGETPLKAGTEPRLDDQTAKALVEKNAGSKTAPWTEAVSKRCEEYQADQKAIAAKWSAKEGLSVDELIAGSLGDGADLSRAFVADLRAISVPDDERHRWADFTGALERVNAELPKYTDEILEGVESDELERLYIEIGEKIRPLTERYDLEACSGVSVG